MLRSICIMSALLLGRIDIARMGQRVCSRPELWEEPQNEGGERELHEHVHAGCEEGEAEAELVGREHPFVVDGDGEGEDVPGGLLACFMGGLRVLRPRFTYHSPMNIPFISMFLMTLWSASFFSSRVISESFTIRLSSLESRLRRDFLLLVPVSPVSSSSWSSSDRPLYPALSLLDFESSSDQASSSSDHLTSSCSPSRVFRLASVVLTGRLALLRRVCLELAPDCISSAPSSVSKLPLDVELVSESVSLLLLFSKLASGSCSVGLGNCA